MSADVIHIREYPKTERERKIEKAYLEIIARMAQEIERLKRKSKRRAA